MTCRWTREGGDNAFCLVVMVNSTWYGSSYTDLFSLNVFLNNFVYQSVYLYSFNISIYLFVYVIFHLHIITKSNYIACA